jgi:ubiquinone/menaquinone biosynthesis C-methylase UbiE
MLQVLDVGCGTGISTRALYASGLTSVFGMDIDPIMLESAINSAKEAEGRSVTEQHYLLGEVSKMQTVFSKEKFSVITSFSSFHWFCTPNEVNAMKTVIKASNLNFGFLDSDH